MFQPGTLVADNTPPTGGDGSSSSSSDGSSDDSDDVFFDVDDAVLDSWTKPPAGGGAAVPAGTAAAAAAAANVSSVGFDPDQKMGFGMNRHVTFREMAESTEEGRVKYCRWARSEKSPGRGLKVLQDFLKRINWKTPASPLPAGSQRKRKASTPATASAKTKTRHAQGHTGASASAAPQAKRVRVERRLDMNAAVGTQDYLAKMLLQAGGPDYMSMYHQALLADGFQTKSELQELDMQDMLDAGMKKGHAKTLARALLQDHSMVGI